MERKCLCSLTKKHRLVFDGGISGNYTILLCVDCYSKGDKQFLISEDILPGEHTWTIANIVANPFISIPEMVLLCLSMICVV